MTIARRFSASAVRALRHVTKRPGIRTVRRNKVANWLYCDNILLTAVPVFCFLVQIALLTETQAAS